VQFIIIILLIFVKKFKTYMCCIFASFYPQVTRKCIIDVLCRHSFYFYFSYPSIWNEWKF